jgi:3-oxoacyl-[acyl-carrier-protein] synthase II
MKRRVVVTGIGVIAPLGIGLEKYWSALKSGQNAIGPITHFDPSGFDSKIAAEVKDFNPEDFIPKKDARKVDRFVAFAIAASRLALDDGGINLDSVDKGMFGVVIGSGIGGMQTLETQHRTLVEKGPGRISPFFIPTMISNMAAGMVGMHFGFQGPNMAIVTACATANHCIGMAADLIRHGRLEHALAGGTEAAITPLGLGGFCAMKALSTRNDDPTKACRPFDSQRDGFVMGEGCGVLLLEDFERAKARGAKIYAEIAGWGMSADAFHMTNPEPEGAGAARAMRFAIADAQIQPGEVGYINAHGTSTPAGDRAETKAIRNVFGEHAPRIPVSSSKSMMGHGLGAAGALESVVTIMAAKEGLFPPTINYEFPDPECDLDYVPNIAREASITFSMNNSFGFGGQNAVLIFRRFDG